MSFKYRNLLIGAATFAGAFYIAAASEPALNTEAADRSSKRVKVAEVSTAESRRDLRFSGVTRAAQRARLAFALGGRITERTVDVGDRVSAGQVVARLDDLELRNAIAGARGSLAELQARRAQSERDVERAERLLAAKAATGEEVEKTRAGLAALDAAISAAEAQVRETERLLKETRLEAPFAGVVTEVHFEPGEVTNPGSSVVALSGDGDVELEVEVPESVAPRIARGDQVGVTVPHHGSGPVDGTVTSVGRAAAGPGSLFPVVVKIADGANVGVGVTAELALRLESGASLSVPVEAVVNPGGRRPALFAVRDNQARKIFVEVGALDGDRVIVQGELTAGDLVVVGGQRGLLDGEPVVTVSEAGGQ
ncbi:MAG: efflux RND transporter periplasmic adaptor subunit [Acidobacteriota bacterium]